ncbi:MAG: hypothetical protein A3A43_03035 [Candidatus Liptonbacteria bacterium RIFCSPLOWO2_01_FULL_56_20]|uniref:DUF4145 domain-containing protein n=1 Tax=Candidatus Liptonbacteria bacterium RIFCSPLOWO2_01_FULL_56_20 TaxID=1798652 RepID=A0A1G2CKS4_9BACT|nr:MAG: hypothetical protein A2681_00165 [Candidatus Liptonbacteria bacterium RIFCSPHIGHO2_01_FULL_56_18b]OGZ01018.1 MAG: hypothetical protein A3A43_03035 [Candidatus Liptonbacteria bacterium RIFCSPLOWO2_01_FULL_56_20]
MSAPFDIGPLRSLFDIARFIFTAVDVALIAVFFYAVFRALHFRPKFLAGGRPSKKVFTLGAKLYEERWGAIMQKYAQGTPEGMRVAIIEADALVDEALKQMGLTGEHMADRLARIQPDEVTTLERLWRAHRLRNDLVHTAGFRISPQDAKNTLEDYEAFLKEIEAF